MDIRYEEHRRHCISDALHLRVYIQLAGVPESGVSGIYGAVVSVIPVSTGWTSVPGRGGASAIPAVPSGG